MNNSTMVVQRHKLVRKSGTPFNSLLRELKDTVTEAQPRASPGSRVRRELLVVSPKVLGRLRKRNIDMREVHEAIAFGKRVVEKKRNTTFARGGGTRLLAENERKTNTVLVEFTSSSTPASLRVRYMRTGSKKNKKYTVIDAYMMKSTPVCSQVFRSDNDLEMKSWFNGLDEYHPKNSRIC